MFNPEVFLSVSELRTKLVDYILRRGTTNFSYKSTYLLRESDGLCVVPKMSRKKWLLLAKSEQIFSEEALKSRKLRR